MIKNKLIYSLACILSFILFFNSSLTPFAEGATTTDTVTELSIQYPDGFKFFAPEEGVSVDVEEPALTAEEIDEQNKAIYNNLSTEAQQLLVSYIAKQDSELTSYQDNTISSGSISEVMSSNYYVSASISATLDILSISLKKLKIPRLARYAFMAVGSSIAVAGADGPLPVGDIIAVVVDLGATIIISYYWDDIKDKWPSIIDAFKKAFTSFSAAITGAFDNIKWQLDADMIKKRLKNWTHTPSALKHVSLALLLEYVGKKDPVEIYGSTESSTVLVIFKFEDNSKGMISNNLDSYNTNRYTLKTLTGRYLFILYNSNKKSLFHAHVRQSKDLAVDRLNYRYENDLNIRILPAPIKQEDQYVYKNIKINITSAQ